MCFGIWCEFAIKIDMYITSVFFTLWWSFHHGQVWCMRQNVDVFKVFSTIQYSAVFFFSPQESEVVSNINISSKMFFSQKYSILASIYNLKSDKFTDHFQEADQFWPKISHTTPSNHHLLSKIDLVTIWGQFLIEVEP